MSKSNKWTRKQRKGVSMGKKMHRRMVGNVKERRENIVGKEMNTWKIPKLKEKM